jgi:hypothetical protein
MKDYSPIAREIYRKEAEIDRLRRDNEKLRAALEAIPDWLIRAEDKIKENDVEGGLNYITEAYHIARKATILANEQEKK